MENNEDYLLILLAYDTASQRGWAKSVGDFYRQAGIDCEVLSLSGRHFHFRLHGSPLSWYDALPEMISTRGLPRLVIATSTTDVSRIKAVIPALAGVPTISYFHENQFAYPPTRESQQQRISAQITQLYSALASDNIIFNSQWNMDSFITGAEELLASLPESLPPSILDDIRNKARVIPVPVTTPGDSAGAPTTSPNPKSPQEAASDAGLNLHIIWPHRWESDKNPGLLLEIAGELEWRQQSIPGMKWSLSILGSRFREDPPELGRLLRTYSENLNLVAEKNAPLSRTDFERVLLEEGQKNANTISTFVLSTALHEFQGVAMIEGTLAGLCPIVPDDLAYPGIFLENFRYQRLPAESSPKSAQSPAASVASPNPRTPRQMQAEKAVDLILNLAGQRSTEAGLDELRKNLHERYSPDQLRNRYLELLR